MVASQEERSVNKGSFEEFADSFKQINRFQKNIQYVLDTESILGNIERRLEDHVVTSFSKVIRDVFWDRLVRDLSIENLESSLIDEKAPGNVARIYISSKDPDSLQYYTFAVTTQVVF